MTSSATSALPVSTTTFAAFPGQPFDIAGRSSDTSERSRTTLRTRSYGVTDIGRHRERNEDSLGYDDRKGIYAVADGIGGSRYGDVASRLAVEALLESVGASNQAYRGGLPAPGSTVRLEEAVHHAHARIRREIHEDESLREMGTTLVSLLVESGIASIVHAGDSRAYLLRGGALERLTRDHTLASDFVTEGHWTPEAARRHPMGHVLTRALNRRNDLAVDSTLVPIEAGDVFLLCSDGLTGLLDDAEICAALMLGGGPEEICGRLVCHALAQGGFDNVTVLVVEVVQGA